MNDRIINSFYYHIAPDASRGKMLTNNGIYNICYNTYVPSEGIEYRYDKDDIFVPTLIINNKDEFDKCLCEYVSVASDFYNDNENLIMAMLFLDATNEDFTNPIEYIKRKTKFILDTSMDSLKKGVNLGYSKLLDGNIYVRLSKDEVMYETPYVLETMVYNSTGSYNFPSVSIGIADDKAYIYSIQKRSLSMQNSIYEKRINRVLYKIGEGFDASVDNFEKYDVGNLKDVSASFVVISSLILGILEQLNIHDIIIPSVRIVRWNNKSIYNDMLFVKSGYKTSIRNELEDKIIRNQSNITDKFLRTFLRTAYHFDGLDVTSYPFELDSNLRLYNEFDLKCNNSLLEEVYEFGKSRMEGKKLC